MNIVFQTPRLLLRRFTEADASLILELNNDPEIVKYIHEPILKTTEQAEKILKDTILPQYQNKLGRWAMQVKETDEFIGWCGLKYRPERDEIDLGYRLMKSGATYSTVWVPYAESYTHNCHGAC
jgi:[ribosomal protein S5]-alanine N-acetyltransferase